MKWNADDVRALRAKLEMTQQQFAVALGTTTSSVTKWERGKSSPRALSRRALTSLAEKHR